MKPSYQPMEVSYKQANPQFPQQFTSFLSQSKHQKQERIEQINQNMIEQFIHLFEICNINKFMDFTKEFIDEIRNVILRLQVVEKKQFQCFDQKDEFMYLVVEGRVQKIKRQKPLLNKRMTKMNMTAFNFNSHSIMNTFNPRSSNNNDQLRQFQRSFIMNRSSRMSMLSGNLWNELFSSPRKKHHHHSKNQQTIQRMMTTCSEGHYQKSRDSPFKLQHQRHKVKQNPIQEGESNALHYHGQMQRTKEKTQYKVQLLEPLQNQVYHCLTKVKYIKLLKWSYDQLVQYIFKYQNDRLIQFLSKSLLISQNEIKYHQVYNKTIFNYFKQRQSRHSSQLIGLNSESIYILRKGSVQFKYECSGNQSRASFNPAPKQPQKNPNLASYISAPSAKFKTIILNEGAIICPSLEQSRFYIQSLERVVFIELNQKLLQYLKTELKGQWWQRKFLKYYKVIQDERALYMKDQEIFEKEKPVECRMKNVFVDTKNRRMHSAKAEKTRFRTEIAKTDFGQNNKVSDEKNIFPGPDLKAQDQNKQNIFITNTAFQDLALTSETSPILDLSSSQCKEFITLLPYKIMVESKQKISKKLSQKSKAKHISDKVFNYLKKNKKSLKYKNKVLELKMKNIAEKEIGKKDLDQIYEGINKNSCKGMVKQSWWKDQNSPTDIQTMKIIKKGSNHESQQNRPQQSIPHRHMAQTKSATQIINLTKNITNSSKKKFTINTMPTSNCDQRKVTFALNNLNTLDDSSDEDEEYLCKDDTGLINKFVQNSHNYQKELSYLINSSQRQDKAQHKKKKLKTCKTEGSNLLFSHNLINDIMKRINNTELKTIINSSKNSKVQSNTVSKSASVCAKQTPENLQDNIIAQKNQKRPQDNLIQAIKSHLNQQQQLLKNSDTISQLQHAPLKTKSPYKPIQKCSSFSNYSSSKSSSYHNLKSHNRSSNPPSTSISNNRKTFTTEQNQPQSKILRHEPHIQSGFFDEKYQKRPNTANAIVTRTECKSLMFNQWIETEPAGSMLKKQQRNSQLGVGNYNFGQRNLVSGDKKIWKRLKSGKIVKKSVKFYQHPSSAQQKSVNLI